MGEWGLGYGEMGPRNNSGRHGQGMTTTPQEPNNKQAPLSTTGEVVRQHPSLQTTRRRAD